MTAEETVTRKKLTIQDLRDRHLIVYEYIRGSKLHGISTPTSDTDFGGVYVAPEYVMNSFTSAYQPTISDEKSDIVFYELRTYLELLSKSNPNALESLFAPDEFVVYCDPTFKSVILNNREMFLSKDAFSSMLGYSYSQIKKARGLNKKITNPVVQRKDILDFCYTFDKQGSIPMKKYLEQNKLKQKYCGLVNVPNMPNMYTVFYDFAAHVFFEHSNPDAYKNFLNTESEESIIKKSTMNEFLGYRGIILDDDNSSSNDVRMSSVPVSAVPICYMSYNKSAYESHCRAYKEYKDWEKHRNPVRYESNIDKNYDSKNIAECIRLIHMGIELATTGKYNVVRTDDRQFLLDVKAHKYEYDEIIDYIDKKRKEFEHAVETTKLNEHVNMEFVTEVLLKFRKDFYNRMLLSPNDPAKYATSFKLYFN